MGAVNDALIAKARSAKRASRHVEFKESFDPTSEEDWREIVKDVVALANSGGGVILFGSALPTVGPAAIAERLHPFTGDHVADVEVVEVDREGRRLTAWLIAPAPVPIVLERGTVYFRHGAKSRPGTTEDIRRAMERAVRSIRKEWLAGVRKVVEAPAGSRVSVLLPEIRESTSSRAAPIRITEDPTAPAYRVVDPDSTYPFRQKELIAEVRSRLPDGIAFNSFDVVAVRRAHGIDSKREFSFKPRFGSRQYSRRLVDWLVAQFEADAGFFEKARLKYRRRDG